MAPLVLSTNAGRKETAGKLTLYHSLLVAASEGWERRLDPLSSPRGPNVLRSQF